MYNYILGIPGSSSASSINRKLVSYVLKKFPSKNSSVLDLNDFTLPLYSIDREQIEGIPPMAKVFLEQIGKAELLVVSLAEHNGSYSTWFKNILDWSSRIDQNVFQKKPMFLMATSPGKRGGQLVLDTALKYFPFMGAEIKASLSIPFFHQAFQGGVPSEDCLREIEKQIQSIV